MGVAKIILDIRRAAHLGPGIAPLVAYAILSAAVDVYAGDELQSRSPISMAAVAFTLVALAFTGSNVIRRGMAATVLPWRTNLSDVLVINVSTTASWLSVLYALKYLEPAIVNVTIVAISPIMTVVLGPILRKGSSALMSEAWASLGICGFLAALAWGSISGHSGVGKIGLSHAVIGIAMMLISGLGATVNVIYSKKLSDAGYDPRSILSVRFYLIIIVSWTIIVVQGNPQLGAVAFPAIVVALLGVGIPLYLIQMGVKHTEPITASLVCTLSPIFAFVLQLPVRRINSSPLSLTCIIGITALVCLGTVQRARQSKKKKSAADFMPERVPETG